MSDECRNDCTEPSPFPRQVFNRPALKRIDYRIGTYADFRDALLRALNQDSVLANWTHREADDPGIALLEGASILGDILTFYQDLYANEAYLRTAQWRESVADLVKLLGYRLSPGVGGKATFAFEVTGEKPVIVPKGFPVKAQLQQQEKSEDFETANQTVAISSLSKFNLFKPITYPDIFPNVTQEFYIYDPPQCQRTIALEKGDRLLVGSPDPLDPLSHPTRLLDAQIVIVDRVQEIHGRQFFTIKGFLSKIPKSESLVGYKIGRTFRHFGHNAPRKYIRVTGYSRIREYNVLYSRNLGAITSSSEVPFTDPVGDTGVRIVEPHLDYLHLALSEQISDLNIGCEFIVQGRLWGYRSVNGDWVGPSHFTFIRTIENFRASSLTWGSLTGATTLVTINQGLPTSSDDGSIRFLVADIRHMEFHETVSPLFRVRAVWEETDESQGEELNLYGTETDAEALMGRRLFFEKSAGESFERSVSSLQLRHWDTTDNPIRRIRLLLDESVDYADFPNNNPTTNVYGNLIEATQGKTEKEAVLGNGDNRETFQTFKLPKSPLTYFRSEEETPPEVPELEIYVNDRLWARVPSFFGYGPKEEIYIVREDADGNSWVQFGDGQTGARLPSGYQNVVARYRTGIGAYGPLREGTTVQAGARLDRLKKILLPGIVTGGDVPETAENAREAAPGKVQGLGRLVSLSDFETEALAIAGVSKAAAVWALPDDVPAVVVTVLMESGRKDEATEVQNILSKANRDRGAGCFPVIVKSGVRQYVYLRVTAGYDGTFRREMLEKSIKEALGVGGAEGDGIDGSKGLFGIRQRRFGQTEYATRIEGTVQNVEGVVWARVEALGLMRGSSDDPLSLREPRHPRRRRAISHRPGQNEGEVLLCLHTAHFYLDLEEVDPTEVPIDA